MNDRSLASSRGRSALPLLGLSLVLGIGTSCGDGGSSADSGVGPDADVGLAEIGFATPTEATTAYVEQENGWDLVGPANWSCLGQTATELPTSLDVTLTGALLDFQEEEPIFGGAMTLYGDEGITGPELANTLSDDAGDYQFTLPTGQTTWAIKIVAEEALDTYQLNLYYEPDLATQTDDIKSVSLLTAQALPAFIGVTRTPGLGIIAGTIYDCDGNVVSGAVAAVSDAVDTPSHVAGGVSYYFSAANTSLPVRHSLQDKTNTDGVFVTIELPPGQERFLQLWGFVDDEDLADGEMALLGQVSAPIVADSVVTVSVRPRAL